MWVNPAPSFPHELLLWQSFTPQTGRLTYLLKFVRTATTGHFRLETRGDDGIARNVDSQDVDIGVPHYLVFSYTPGTAPLLFVDGVARRTSEPVSGTLDFPFQTFSRFEGDLDELHLTFHAFTDAEALDRWCPP
jgi:hypothetical protein